MDNRLEYPRRKIKRIKPQTDPKKNNDGSKELYQFYQNLTQPCILKLKNERDKLVYAAWLFRLKDASEPFRIKVIQLMLVSLQNIHSFSIFSNFPPADLADLKINTEEDIIKLLRDFQTQTDTIEKNRDVLQETKSDRRVAVSSDLCSYVAVKTTKNLVQSFFVRSDTLIHSWNNPQKIILPTILDSNQWEKSLRRLDLECQQNKCNPVTLKDGCESIMNMEQVSKEIVVFRWNEHSILTNNRPILVTSHIDVDQDIGNQPSTQRTIDETAKNIVQNKSFPGYKMLNPKAYSTIIVANAELVLNTTGETADSCSDQTIQTQRYYFQPPENETQNCGLPQNETSMRTTKSDTACRSTQRLDDSERHQPSTSCAARKNNCKRLSKTCNDDRIQQTPRRSSSCRRRNKTLHDRPSTLTLCCNRTNNERGQAVSPLSTVMEISSNCSERRQRDEITHYGSRASNVPNRTNECNNSSCVSNRNGQASLNDSSNYDWTMSSADLTTNQGGSPQTPSRRNRETPQRHSNAQQNPIRREISSNCSERDQAGVIIYDSNRASNGSNRANDCNNNSCASNRNGQASLNDCSNYDWTMSSADLPTNGDRLPQTQTCETSQSHCNAEQNPSSRIQNRVSSRRRHERNHAINVSSDSRYDGTCGFGTLEESESINPGTDQNCRASHSHKYSYKRRRSHSVPNTTCGHQRSPTNKMSRENNVSCSARLEDRSGPRSFNVSNGNNNRLLTSPGTDHSLYRPVYDDNWDPDLSRYSTFQDRTNQHDNASTFVTSEQQQHGCRTLNRRSSLPNDDESSMTSMIRMYYTDPRNEMASSRLVSIRPTDLFGPNSRNDSKEANGTRDMVEAWLDGHPGEGCTLDSVPNRWQRNNNQTNSNASCSAQLDLRQDRTLDVTNDTTEPSIIRQNGYNLARDETISRALYNEGLHDSRWDPDVSGYSTFRKRNRRWINDSGHVLNERLDYSLPRRPSLFDMQNDYEVDPSAGIITDHWNYRNESLNSRVLSKTNDQVKNTVGDQPCCDRVTADRTAPRVVFEDDRGDETEDDRGGETEDVDIRSMQMPINSFSSTEPDDSRTVNELSNTSFQNTNNSNFSQICAALRRRRR